MTDENPFTLGITKEKDLIGRGNEKRQIAGYIENNDSGIFLITGEKGIGKSSILWNSYKDTQKIEDYNCIFFKIESGRELILFERIKGPLKPVYELIREIFLPVKEAEIRGSVEGGIPSGEFGLKFGGSGGPATTRDNKSVYELMKWIVRSEKKLIIFIDDAFNLSKEYQTLLDFISKNTRVFFILAYPDHEKGKILPILKTNSGQISLPSLEQKYCEEVLKKADFLSRDEIEKISKISEGNPYILSLIGWVIYQKKLDDKPYSRVISHLEDRALGEKLDAMHEEILSCLSGDTAKKMIKNLSLGPKILTFELIEAFSLVRDLDSDLNELKDKGMIIKKEDFYWIFHNLFREYLRDRQPQKLSKIGEVYLKAAKKISGRIETYLILNELKDRIKDFELVLRGIKNFQALLGFGYHCQNIGNLYQAHLSFKKVLEDSKEEKESASALSGLGIDFYISGDSKKALEYYEKALEIYKEVGYRQGKANTYINMGIIYANRGDSEKALEYYEEALKIHKEVGDRQGEANVYTNMGIIYANRGDSEKALEHYEEALKIHKEVGDRLGEASYYTNMGNIYAHVGDSKKALEYHEKALKIHREVGYRQGVANAYTNKGNIYAHVGDSKKALEYHEKALKVNKEIGYRQGEANAYTNIGNIYADMGDSKKALEHYEKALEIHKEIGYRRGEANAYTNMGNIYAHVGDSKKALEHHEKALKIHKEIGYRLGETGTYGNMGVIYADLGDFEKAFEYYEKALEINKEIGYREGVARAYTNMGNIYVRMGDFEKALEHHEKALEINKEIGYKQGEASAYGNMGVIYANLGDFEKALEHHKKALKIHKEVEYRQGEANAYTNMGNIYAHMGGFEKALEHYEKALEIYREIEYRQGEANAYTNMGNIYASMDDSGKALEHYEKALEIHKEIGDRLGEAKDYGNIGLLNKSKGDLDGAVTNINKAIEIFKEIDSNPPLIKAHLNLFEIFMNMNRSNKAVDELQNAFDCLKFKESFPPVFQAFLGFIFHNAGQGKWDTVSIIEKMNFATMAELETLQKAIINYSRFKTKKEDDLKEFNNAKEILPDGLRKILEKLEGL